MSAWVASCAREVSKHGSSAFEQRSPPAQAAFGGDVAPLNAFVVRKAQAGAPRS